MMRSLVAFALALATSGCATLSNPGFAQGLAGGLATQNGVAPPFVWPEGTPDFLIFGGRGHDVFLGCLSCPQVDASSVFNPAGAFGSAFSPNSIFNKSGAFGSASSPISACSVVVTDPPVVVDRAGTYYGELTVNEYRPRALSHRVPSLLPWLTKVCDPLRVP